METGRAYWPIWTDILRRQGLADLVALALDAAGPLNILGAQVLYIGQPFVPSSASQGWSALVHLLEQEDEAQAFAAMLKGKTQ
jgi:hypothetical protein